MKVGGDVLGDDRHPDDNLVVMAAKSRFWAITSVFAAIFSYGRCLTIVLGYLV